MDSDLVSVIIPAYRAARFIPSALESVRAQRYRNWEVVVVEDGSSDGTQQLVEAFAASMAPRRVIYERHPENRGLGNTRNTSMRIARGEYLAFLDADDGWLETYLEAAVGTLAKTGADIAYATPVLVEDGTGLP